MGRQICLSYLTRHTFIDELRTREYGALPPSPSPHKPTETTRQSSDISRAPPLPCKKLPGHYSPAIGIIFEYCLPDLLQILKFLDSSSNPVVTSTPDQMATEKLESAPTPTRPKSTNGVINVTKASTGDTRIVVIIYGQGQEKIVSVFADVLGKPYRLEAGFSLVGNKDHGTVIGIAASDAKVDIRSRDRMLMVAINAHCVGLGMPPDHDLSATSDYEFLYTETPFFRRDLSRFIAFTLGQISHHEALITKPRTYFISTTFPDVRMALSNLDILSVGSDAVEIRVDLLREPLPDGTFSSVPSLSYVGEQVMLLRQRTELPIIFTTRCTRENGRFPMDNPELYYQYLYRAIQWGCEYIDVEIWLPEDIRRTLFEQRGNSRIISAFHDFSGTFKWPSRQAQSIFEESRKYGDIVKMITIINSMSENYELEYFRSQIKANNPDGPPLSAVNMGQLGQLSRALNTVFSPITHPLLPIVAAPGQMSAAEINGALSTMGQFPKKNIYAIGSFRSTPQATFFEKCFNELGLPHNFVSVDRGVKAMWRCSVYNPILEAHTSILLFPLANRISPC